MTEQLADSVCIRIQPDEDMIQVFRLVTTALSSRVGLNLDQADDLNTALEELFRFVISSVDEETTFRVHYSVLSDRLEVTAEGVPLDLSDDSSKVNRYSRFVIDSITDDLCESPNPEGGYNILMVKYLST
ncbi:MAG TPA: hypothetical protein ENH44_03350 [Actinobacteria bacterium]|nr:hypothetical protein [Actinomycetota bacterium]